VAEHDEPTATLTVLGSGTLLPDERRSSAAYHLQTAGWRLLLDCGSGTLHGFARHRIDWRELDAVAVTHFHSDHVGDLPGLLAALRFIGRTRSLAVVGPQGLADFLGHLASAFGAYVLEPGFDLRVEEIDEGGTFEAEGPDRLTVRGCPTPHTEESLALKLSGPWGQVGYTGDTGPAERVSGFLKGCDALVAECALADPPSMDRHLSPRGVAALARVAMPELLIVTHVYPPQSPAEALGLVRAGYSGRAVAAWDGLRARIGPDGVTVDPSTDPL
jgi:ribonuclease BN (tRNA processing enzyme)